MEINVNKQPAIAPACFGMPSRGHASETVTKADLGIATTYVPGTSAWRPPSS